MSRDSCDGYGAHAHLKLTGLASHPLHPVLGDVCKIEACAEGCNVHMLRPHDIVYQVQDHLHLTLRSMTSSTSCERFSGASCGYCSVLLMPSMTHSCRSSNS